MLTSFLFIVCCVIAGAYEEVAPHPRAIVQYAFLCTASVSLLLAVFHHQLRSAESSYHEAIEQAAIETQSQCIDHSTHQHHKPVSDDIVKQVETVLHDVSSLTQSSKTNVKQFNNQHPKRSNKQDVVANQQEVDAEPIQLVRLLKT